MSAIHMVTTWGVTRLLFSTASDYVRNYHNIQVPEYRVVSGQVEKTAAMINTPVREYLNDRHTNRAGLAPHVRIRLKDHLLSADLGYLFKGRLDVRSQDNWLTISKGSEVLLSVNKLAVGTCFYGKGSPAMLAQAIELLGLWTLFRAEVLNQDKKVLKGTFTTGKGEDKREVPFEHAYEIEDLQTMVDSYLGVDCNGFTGQYLKAKFPSLTVKPGTEEETYASKKDYLRKTVADIAVNDTAVFHNGGRYHHVAMVSQVVPLSDDEVQVALAESRSAGMVHGGPQVNLWRVRRQKEEAKFDVIGRGGERFVRFVSPDRFKA
jgi:hypothetical protein